MKSLYIAAPFTSNPSGNTNAAIGVGMTLFELKLWLPFIPHSYLMWDLICPRGYEYWMDMCIGWVAECDAFLRLPGVSPGADREYDLARKLDKTIVIYSSLPHEARSIWDYQ